LDGEMMGNELMGISWGLVFVVYSLCLCCSVSPNPRLHHMNGESMVNQW
jgi:hypothetical protein